MGIGASASEELGQVVARELHDVLLHRERDHGAVRRPRERVAVPHEPFHTSGLYLTVTSSVP